MAKFDIYNYTLNEMTVDEDGFPYVRIKVNHLTVGYLMPFRGYRFQVSGTTNGIGDIGSSPVVHFKDSIKDMHPGDAMEFLTGQAIIALENMCRHTQAYINLPGGMNSSMIVGPRTFDEFIKFYNGYDERHIGMNDFIKSCYEWIMK